MSRKGEAVFGGDGTHVLRAALRRRLAVLVLSAASILAGCSPEVQNHGYVPNDADLSEIVVGVDDRASVEDTIGTPSAAGVLNDQGYYYVAQRVRQRGWREPEVISREIVAISFDGNGTVRNVERFGLEDGNVIALSRRVTDSSVQGIGFLRQLAGNLGRIAPGAIGGTGAPPQ